MNAIKILNQIAQTIYDKKGFNILVLDVRGICSITDYFVIAEGSVGRHAKAISQALEEELLKSGQHVLHIEGEQDGDWIVLDYVDFIIHLFIPEFREQYALEQLWKNASIVDVKIDTSAPEIKKSLLSSFNELKNDE